VSCTTSDGEEGRQSLGVISIGSGGQDNRPEDTSAGRHPQLRRRV